MPISNPSTIRWTEHDETVMPVVEISLGEEPRLIIGEIARVTNTDLELYVPVPVFDNRANGGLLELTEAQARHLHKELGLRLAEMESVRTDEKS